MSTPTEVIKCGTRIRSCFLPEGKKQDLTPIFLLK
jgi:hypothetical protein